MQSVFVTDLFGVIANNDYDKPPLPALTLATNLMRAMTVVLLRNSRKACGYRIVRFNTIICTEVTIGHSVFGIIESLMIGHHLSCIFVP